ncbi:DUF4012 domain-containing protein [Candidatus Gottesmanbacteria bacterium]|nr:DUF4012 domain-containing protein [Candidatus Gottesmanbacteria bacterium]
MTDGFAKINLEENTKKPVVVEKKMKLPKKYLKLIAILLVIFGGFLIVTLILARDFYNSLKVTISDGKNVSAAVKSQNIEEAEKGLKKLQVDLVQNQEKYNRLAYFKFIPLANLYYEDGARVLRAGSNGIDAGLIAIESLLPYSDLLGLKGKGTFVGGSADERIQTAVKTFDKVTPRLKDISSKIELIQKDLDDIDPNRYPQKVGKTVIRSRLISTRNIFDETANLFINARPLLEELPKVLGEPDEKRYLIIFQNDAERRATGGFITAYAVFKIKGGKLIVERSDDIYKLDESKSKKFPAPPEILTYHKNVFTLELRDSNLSPDFIKSMKKFEEILSTVNGFPKYDGIIAIDTHVLVESMKILGSIPAYGTNFTAENDKRCDCPNVVYELELYADKPAAYVKGSRKDIIGVLLYQIMQKALGISPSQYWGRLFQMAISEMEQKHILFYLHDPKSQGGLEALNFSGKIKDIEGNYLHINNVNFAGAKSNLFVEEFVKYDLSRDKDGLGTVTLTLDYKNPAPPSDCGLESGGLCLNGLLRNWIRVYVPKGSKLLDFKGSEKDVKTYEDLGKTVFEGFFTVKPQGASQAIVRYKLPTKIEKGKNDILLIQKQPGTDDNEYEILINGKSVEKFPLIKDHEVKIKI